MTDHLESSFGPEIRWIGQRVFDVYGARLGRAEALVTQGEEPRREWLLIEAGRFQKSRKLIPFADAIVGSHEIWVPVDRDTIMASPSLESDEPAHVAEAIAAIEQHYAVGATS